MISGKFKTSLPCFIAALLIAAPLHVVATPDTETPAEASFINRFRAGQREAALTSGVLFSPLFVRTKRPSIYYTQSALQMGWMVSNPHGPGLLHGNFQLAGEVFGGAIFKGHGNCISGGTFWFRRNFVYPNWRMVPYVQIGAGVTFTDADRVLVGQTFNFNLDAGIGARWLVSRRCSMSMEYRYQHISNANQARHNLGINGQGPVLGVSFFF